MLNIVLDIDNTLVDTLTAKVEGMPSTRIQGTNFHVHPRPHLECFLDWLFENFTVSLWTAGSGVYADWIAENIVGTRKGKKLEHVLNARDVQESINMYGTPKSLRYLNNIDPRMGPENTLLIDDTSNNFEKQEKNGILIRPFDVRFHDQELNLLPERIIKQFCSLAPRS